MFPFTVPCRFLVEVVGLVLLLLLLVVVVAVTVALVECLWLHSSTRASIRTTRCQEQQRTDPKPTPRRFASLFLLIDSPLIHRPTHMPTHPPTHPYYEQTSVREVLGSLLPSDRAAAAAYLLAVRTGTFPRKLMRQVQEVKRIGADRPHSVKHTFPVVSGAPSSATLFRLSVSG